MGSRSSDVGGILVAAAGGAVVVLLALLGMPASAQDIGIPDVRGLQVDAAHQRLRTWEAEQDGVLTLRITDVPAQPPGSVAREDVLVVEQRVLEVEGPIDDVAVPGDEDLEDAADGEADGTGEPAAEPTDLELISQPAAVAVLRPANPPVRALRRQPAVVPVALGLGAAVPDLRDRTLEQAGERIDDAGLGLDVVPSDAEATWLVAAQDPPDGVLVPFGTAVTVRALPVDVPSPPPPTPSAAPEVEPPEPDPTDPSVPEATPAPDASGPPAPEGTPAPPGPDTDADPTEPVRGGSGEPPGGSVNLVPFPEPSDAASTAARATLAGLVLAAVVVAAALGRTGGRRGRRDRRWVRRHVTAVVAGGAGAGMALDAGDPEATLAFGFGWRAAPGVQAIEEEP